MYSSHVTGNKCLRRYRRFRNENPLSRRGRGVKLAGNDVSLLLKHLAPPLFLRIITLMSRRPIILSVAFKRPFSTYTYSGVEMSEKHFAYGVIGDVCRLIEHDLKATPLLVTTASKTDDIMDLVRLADGIIISGGNSNVNPKLYGQKPLHARQFFDDERDSVERALLQAALQQKIPSLMICRGMQLLNVHFGGTLQQELPQTPIDHNCSLPTKASDEIYNHALLVEPSSHLAQWLKPDGKPVEINSIHEQGIDRLADNLAIEARAPDGTIEAVRCIKSPHFVYGVQWHPDYNPALPASKAVLDAFMVEVHKTRRRGFLRRFLAGR